MIHHLRGRLVEKTPTYAVVECGGVGYQVHISLNTFEQLGNEESVMLHTHMVVREDAQLLYGFSQPEERTMFLLLLGVSGVGASTARMILSAMNVDQAAQAIQFGDVNAMKSVKGIGAKPPSASSLICRTNWALSTHRLCLPQVEHKAGTIIRGKRR